jgi:hypothetical protein
MDETMFRYKFFSSDSLATFSEVNFFSKNTLCPGNYSFPGKNTVH